MVVRKKAPGIRKPAEKARVFYAPHGYKRLTINVREDLHKKLKITAIEKGQTAGEIIEEMIGQYL